MSEVVVLPDAASVAQAAAEIFVEATAGAVAARGRALVALTGGSSAPPLFAALRGEPWRSRVPWAQLEIFFSDERAVPPSDPLSNAGLAQRELLGPLGIAPERVHRLRGEAQDLTAEAARADLELRRVAAGGGGHQNGTSGRGSLLQAAPERSAPPRLDLLLLGLGPDGHICSLFQGDEAVLDRGDGALLRMVPAPTHVEPHVARLSLSPAAVVMARTVLLMTVGEKKAAVLARALKGAEDVKACPAQWLRRASGRVVVACDSAAAGGL